MVVARRRRLRSDNIRCHRQNVDFGRPRHALRRVHMGKITDQTAQAKHMQCTLTMSSRCFASPRARDQLCTLRAQHHDAVSFSTNDRNGDVAMSTMALTRCMLSSQREEGVAQAPCQRTLPRPTQRARLPTHACRRANMLRANPPGQRCLEQDASPSATSTEATLHASVVRTWFARTIMRNATAVTNRKNKPAHQLSPRAAAGSPPPTAQRAAAPSARTVGSSSRLRRRARL